ncbi:NAD-dependent deacetylase [Acidobacteria bacterium Mor1]|nr:NAD-dependent deacetylase [Acidobacteria bacterium Mor1]
MSEQALRGLAGELREVGSVLFVTGAGISADSGLPTYRGVGGLYDQGETDEGLPIEALLSGETFRTRPEWTWKYLLEIEASGREAQPNSAHRVIASLEQQIDRVWTLTQNVDGLHAAAGSENLIEIHGNLHGLRCTGCARRHRVEDYSALSLPPRCEECSAIIRPEVILFGEMLPADALARLQAELRRGFDLVVNVGTSALFPYILEPLYEAKARRKATAEIDPGETVVSAMVDYRIPLGAAEAFERLEALLG